MLRVSLNAFSEIAQESIARGGRLKVGLDFIFAATLCLNRLFLCLVERIIELIKLFPNFSDTRK